MRFTVDAHGPLERGELTVTFRTWARPQARVGGRYRVGPVVVVVDALEQVPLASVSDADARAAGEADRAALVTRLRRGAPGLGDDDLVWRARLHTEPPDDEGPRPDERDELSDDEVADLVARLDAMDARAAVGPWTRATLALIDERPGTVSTELAEVLGRERFELKADVRKLKRLGLTRSLEVGYELSPCGRALLDRLTEG